MSIQLHGGDIYAFNRPILDFSASINPLGTPKSVMSAARESLENINKYPDDKCRALTAAIAQKEGVLPENIICGAEELIYTILQALRPKRVLTVSPAFSEYEFAAKSVGAEIIKYTLDEKNGFCIEEDILNYVKQADITVICDPNNPTGTLADRELLKKITENSAFTVIDKSFAAFCGKTEKITLNKSCAVLKSFTKMYAIPGLRLGYAAADGEIIKKINAAKPRWSVSTPAQAAGLAALKEEDFVKKSVEYINAEKEYFYKNFAELGIKFFKSDANFILFKCSIPLYEVLLERDILIRDCKSFGLDGYYRTAVKMHSENEALITVLKECLQ